MNVKNLKNILDISSTILNFKQFEAVKFGNWYQPFFDISFLFDNYSNIGYFKLGVKNQDKQLTSIEMRSLGKPNAKKEYASYKLTFPQDIVKNDDFNFNFFIEDLIDLLNMNKLGYKFNIVEIKYQKGLLPSATISSDKLFSFSDFEKIVYSLKEVNYLIKDFWIKNI